MIDRLASLVTNAEGRSVVHERRAWLAIDVYGDLQRGLDEYGRAREALGRAEPTLDEAWVLSAMGRVDEALEMLERIPESVDESGPWYIPKPLVAALMSSRTSDDARTRSKAIEAIAPLETARDGSPRNIRYRLALGTAYALAGRHEEAIAEGQLSVDIMPRSRDYLRGSDALLAFAEILAFCGEQERALDVLEEYVGGYAPEVIFAGLRYYAAFQPLLGNPRFEALVGDFAS